MSTSVADLVRVQPPQPSAAILPPKTVAAPTRKFDDVLSQQRAEKAKPDAAAKADPAKPAKKPAKADDTKKTDAADTADHDSDEKADATTTSEASKTDATAKPTQAAGKTVKKTKGDDAADGDDSADASTDTDSTTQAAVGAVKDPTQQAADDGPPKDADADDKLPVKKKADATATAEPDAAAATTAVTPTPPAAAKAVAETLAPTDATVAVASVSAGKAGAKKPAGLPDGTATEATGDAAKVAVKPQKPAKAAAAPAEPDADATGAIRLPADVTADDADPSASDTDADAATAAMQAIASQKAPSAETALPPVQTPQAAPEPQRTVAETNVDHIVTSVRGELLTKGGTMQIRLDPPTLGTVHVQIDVAENGSLSASIQTNNEQATRMLSRSLTQLKTSLESAGVTVDHIQVKQAAPGEQSSNSQTGDQADRGSQNNATQDQSAKQEQQRREMLQRMWAKLAGTGDPLDLVA